MMVLHKLKSYKKKWWHLLNQVSCNKNANNMEDDINWQN